MSRPDAILIAGPTASGKSALALALAQKFGGTIVNADSMQVYGDLRIITARPSAAEEASVPHRLYGHVDAAQDYSVGNWIVEARSALAEVRAAGRIPILVGGTGLYFKILTRGLAAVPEIPAEIRADVRQRLARDGALALHAELTRRDPAAAARIKPADRSRIARALEVIEATGRSLTDWHRDGMPAILDPTRAAKVFLMLDGADLRERIETRFDAMLAQGALAEIRALDARDLDPLLPAMKAHGVPWLRRHLAGEISLEAAAEGAKQDTRRYAKRQLTWFRNQMPDWRWVPPELAAATVMEQFDAVGTAAAHPA